MPSLRNALVFTTCNQYDDETHPRTVFYLPDLLQATYPEVPIGPGFLADAQRTLLSVMKRVEGQEDTVLIPLTQHYFTHYRDSLPDTEKEARRCVAGAMPRHGRAVGFCVPGKDILTHVWRKFADGAAIGHVNNAKAKDEKLIDRLGLEKPKVHLQNRLQHLLK